MAQHTMSISLGKSLNVDELWNSSIFGSGLISGSELEPINSEGAVERALRIP